MTGHLGVRVTALADDALGAEERDRALAHLTRCADCRAALARERRTKALVATLSAPVPSHRLLAELGRMGEPGGPLPPAGGGPPAATAGWDRPRGRRRGRAARSAPRGRADATRPAWAPKPRSRLAAGARAAAAGSALAAAVALGLAAVGAPAARPPAASVVPPVDELTVEHVSRTGGLPFGDTGVVLPARGLRDSQP